MLQKTEAPASPPAHLLGVLRTLWQWRTPILGLTAAAAVLSIIVSLLLPNWYTASTSFLVVSPDQFSLSVLFSADSRAQRYGNSDDIDRIMAIAEGDELIDRMVERFHLYKVYDIDSTDRRAPVYVRREFLSHYEVTKTPRDVIVLSVEDKDPERAAIMARTARDVTDEITLRLLRSSQRRTEQDLQLAIREREVLVDSRNRSLAELRERSGIYDTETQSETLAGQSTTLDQRLIMLRGQRDRYASVGGRGARDSIAKIDVALAGLEQARVMLDSQLNTLNSNINVIEGLSQERARLNDALSYNRIRAKEYATVLNSVQRTIEVVEDARPPVVKSSPIRWLIVVVATLLGFLFAVLGALAIESGRRYDWSRITG